MTVGGPAPQYTSSESVWPDDDDDDDDLNTDRLSRYFQVCHSHAIHPLLPTTPPGGSDGTTSPCVATEGRRNTS